MNSNFDKAFAVVVGIEAGFTDSPEDPGNWTGGAKGVGQLKGTKYGVSAKSYPDLDIANLTLDGAKALYRRDYWNKVRGDDLPAVLDLFALDAAINQGVEAGIRMLQKVAGVAQDGIIGPATIAGLKRDPEAAARFMAARAQRYIGTRNFDRYGDGWFKRLFMVAMEAA